MSGGARGPKVGAAVAAVVVVLGVIAVVVLTRGDGDVSGSDGAGSTTTAATTATTSTIVLPSVPDLGVVEASAASADRRYLEGEGAPLLDLHRQIAASLTADGVECDRLASGASTGPSGVELLVLTGPLADDVARDGAIAEIKRVEVVRGECTGDGDGANADPVEELKRAFALADARYRELGVIE